MTVGEALDVISDCELLIKRRRDLIRNNPWGNLGEESIKEIKRLQHIIDTLERIVYPISITVDKDLLK